LYQLRAVVYSFEDVLALNQLELGRTGLINTPLIQEDMDQFKTATIPYTLFFVREDGRDDRPDIGTGCDQNPPAVTGRAQ